MLFAASLSQILMKTLRFKGKKLCPGKSAGGSTVLALHAAVTLLSRLLFEATGTKFLPGLGWSVKETVLRQILLCFLHIDIKSGEQNRAHHCENEILVPVLSQNA